MAESLAGKWQEVDGSQWLDMAAVDPLLRLVIDAWDEQTEATKATVVRLFVS